MNKKRVLMIDAQQFQSFSLHRGVGKYSLSLLESLNREENGTYDKKILIFNNSGMDENDLHRIRKIASRFEIKFLPLRRAWPSHHAGYEDIERTNKEILNAYVQKFQNCQTDFLILALFQHAECPTYPNSDLDVRRFMLVYDLIPLLHSDTYLRDFDAARTYLTRFKVFYEADHFFTISRAVGNDLAVHLGIAKDKITPINGAAASRMRLKPKPVRALENTGYILFPSGDDHRKNNLRTVLAFAAFNRKRAQRYKLAITSEFGEKTRRRLENFCGDLVFTGNVPDNQMTWLYQNTALVLFTSTVEGLGMPILEAVEFNKPVVCSDIDIFREIHGTAFDFCDPYEAESIEEAITGSFKRGLTIDVAAYQKILKSYSWTKIARRLLNEISKPPAVQPMKKPRIAVFAPTPDGYSAIGKVVQEQHYELSRRADVDYYLEAGLSDKAKEAKLRENLLPSVAKVMDPWQFDAAARRQYDKVIYHIGNSEYHPATLIKALSFPASVVIHDPTIKSLYGVAHAEGLLSEQRVAAEGRLQELIRPREAEFLTSLLSRQTEVVTHSAHMNEVVEESLSKANVKRPKITKLNLTTAIPYRVDINQRAKNDFTVVIAGLVHEAKGLAIVKKITKLKLLQKTLIIKIVGFPLLLESTEAELIAIGGVQLVYSPSDARFLRELCEADVVLSYRPNYQGEPSLAVLEALRLGKAIIVNKQGWFDQLPEGLVYKARTATEAVKLITKVSQEDQTAAAKRRIQYVEDNHSISDYVESLLGDIRIN